MCAAAFVWRFLWEDEECSMKTIMHFGHVSLGRVGGWKDGGGPGRLDFSSRLSGEMLRVISNGLSRIKNQR